MQESNYSVQEQESAECAIPQERFTSSAACLIYSALHCKNMLLMVSSCFLTHLAMFLTL